MISRQLKQLLFETHLTYLETFGRWVPLYINKDVFVTDVRLVMFGSLNSLVSVSEFWLSVSGERSCCRRYLQSSSPAFVQELLARGPVRSSVLNLNHYRNRDEGWLHQHSIIVSRNQYNLINYFFVCLPFVHRNCLGTRRVFCQRCILLSSVRKGWNRRSLHVPCSGPGRAILSRQL